MNSRSVYTDTCFIFLACEEDSFGSTIIADNTSILGVLTCGSLSQIVYPIVSRNVILMVDSTIFSIDV